MDGKIIKIMVGAALFAVLFLATLAFGREGSGRRLIDFAGDIYGDYDGRGSK
ncbi:MAG: hypothetical protein FWB85_08750 [Chitinispirillia bacterium]|nr:hypothetical protein [Chitinispirillia bacterium]